MFVKVTSLVLLNFNSNILTHAQHQKNFSKYEYTS